MTIRQRLVLGAVLLLAVALVVVATVASRSRGTPEPHPTTAPAFREASFPTQSLGNRGVDTQAAQYLLAHHLGRGVPQVAATEVFDVATATAVRAFQQFSGLPATGVVDTPTWRKLATPVRDGVTGPAVMALQVQLNRKRDAGLTLSGRYDEATRATVRAFQHHARLDADGVVGTATWRNLLWHFDDPDFRAGICDRDPDGNGKANWGTAAAVAQIEAAARVFAATRQGMVPLGDISNEHGGEIRGHGSHEVGLDVDVWPIRTDNGQCDAGRITWRSPTYDRAATRQLIHAITSTAPGHVARIFFNDPTLIKEGLTRWQANHDNHLHVRYCEKAHPNPRYTC